MISCYQARRQRLRDTLCQGGAALLFSGEEIPLGMDMTYPFSVDRNFFYLTGLRLPGAAVLLSPDGEKLLLPTPDPRREIYEGPQMTPEEMAAAAGFAWADCAVGLDPLDVLPQAGTVYLDGKRPPTAGYHSPAARLAEQLREAGREVADVYPLVYALRRVKDAGEIEKLRRAVDVVDESLRYMAAHCRPGMTEGQYKATFEYAMAMRGSKPSFPSIVAAGKNSVYLHYEGERGVVRPGELLLLDVGAYVEHYASDISRTFPVGGFTPRQKAIYNLVYDVTRLVLEHMQPYHRYQEHVDAMCAYFSKYLQKLHIADTEPEQERFLRSLSRGCCHHMGLDAHDGYAPPEELLLPGMVFTNEPGVYLPAEGIGVRIEEDLLITETGNELLSAAIPAAPQDAAAFLG